MFPSEIMWVRVNFCGLGADTVRVRVRECVRKVVVCAPRRTIVEGGGAKPKKNV